MIYQGEHFIFSALSLFTSVQNRKRKSQTGLCPKSACPGLFPVSVCPCKQHSWDVCLYSRGAVGPPPSLLLPSLVDGVEFGTGIWVYTSPLFTSAASYPCSSSVTGVFNPQGSRGTEGRGPISFADSIEFHLWLMGISTNDFFLKKEFVCAALVVLKLSL